MACGTVSDPAAIGPCSPHRKAPDISVMAFRILPNVRLARTGRCPRALSRTRQRTFWNVIASLRGESREPAAGADAGQRSRWPDHAGRRCAEGDRRRLRSSSAGGLSQVHPAGRAGAPRGVASVVPAKERVLELGVPVAFTTPSVRLLTDGNSHTPWAASSAGRALRSQRRGREFDPPAVHQPPLR